MIFCKRPPVLKAVIIITLALVMTACGDKPSPVATGGAGKINVLQDPLQEPYPSSTTFQRQITGGGITLIPVATYRIAGIVMSKRKYTQGWGAEIAPFDLALVWGMLTYPHVQAKLSIKHDSTRMAWFHVTGDAPPVDFSYAMSHGSNNHIIPANENIRKVVDSKVRVHDQIVLEGYLVNVEGRNQEQRISMKSSLTRKDSNRGACEIIYVTGVQVEDKMYR